MIRDDLNPPGKTPHDKMPNYDGSNRLLFLKIKRFITIEKKKSFLL
jgi:hypothetical protein